MATTRVVRYTSTDSNYSLEVGLQQTNTSRPGFSNSSGRKLWTTNANGTNTVQLNSSPNPESGQSIIGMQAQASDPAIKSNNGISATKCKAVFTGAATVNISASTLNNKYDSETIYHTETLDGLYVSSSQWQQTFNGTNSVRNNNTRGLPTTFTFSPRTLYVTGSAVTLLDDGQNANFDQLTTGNNLSKVNISVAFDGSSSETFVHSVNHTGSLVRTWEADDIIINGSDSSHTLPVFASSFATNFVGSMVRNPGQVSVNTAFTLAEASECFNFGEADLSSSFTMSVSPTVLFKPTVAVASSFELQATTFNFVRMDPVTAASAFTVAVTPTFKLGTALAITSTATLTESNKVIFDVEGDYTWNQFSNNPFIETGYVKGGYTNDAEYEWDDLTTDSWNAWTCGTWLGDEAGWDQWPGDTWNREFELKATFTLPDVVHLHTKFSAAALTSAFTFFEGAAFLQDPGAQTFTSAFTLTATAQGLIDIPNTTLASAFTLAVSDVDFKDNLEPLTLNSAFTLATTPTHIQNQPIAISGAFTFGLSTVFVKYDITDTAPSAFTVDFVANIKYAPTVPTFNALATTLNVGRLLIQADPFHTITVDAETRTIVIPSENRITGIMAENRLNTIINENRLVEIMQETRTHKLKIPSITDRFSTPRVRSET